MELDIVTYTQAVALDELKYDLTPWFGNAASLYDKDGNHAMYVNYGMMYSGLSDGYILAPLKSQVFRWFREKYNIHGEVFVNDNETFIYLISRLVPQGRVQSPIKGNFTTYEEAENACIDELISISKGSELETFNN